jgi:hypothetical protein
MKRPASTGGFLWQPFCNDIYTRVKKTRIGAEHCIPPSWRQPIRRLQVAFQCAASNMKTMNRKPVAPFECLIALLFVRIVVTVHWSFVQSDAFAGTGFRYEPMGRSLGKTLCSTLKDFNSIPLYRSSGSVPSSEDVCLPSFTNSFSILTAMPSAGRDPSTEVSVWIILMLFPLMALLS